MSTPILPMMFPGHAGQDPEYEFQPEEQGHDSYPDQAEKECKLGFHDLGSFFLVLEIGFHL